MAPATTWLGLYETRSNPYMGRYPDKRLAGVHYLGVPVQYEHPFEDPAIGCPGAWYRTPYVDSLDKYTRRRTKDGGRVPNPLFDGADWQIQRAVMRYEDEIERWHAYMDRVTQERFEARQQAAESTHTRGKGRRR